MIAQPYIGKLIGVMERLKKGFGIECRTNVYGKYSAFVFAKNMVVFKHLIEKHYIQNKVSRFNRPYYKEIYNLYFTPVIHEHSAVFMDILNSRDGLLSLGDSIVAERGYTYILGDTSGKTRKGSDGENILMGFDLDACTIYKIYEEYQNHDMEQIKQIVDNLPPKSVRGKENDTSWIRLFKDKKPTKDIYSRRIYNKPTELLTPLHKTWRIICFDYQESFYKTLFADWIKNGSMIIESIPNLPR